MLKFLIKITIPKTVVKCWARLKSNRKTFQDRVASDAQAIKADFSLEKLLSPFGLEVNFMGMMNRIKPGALRLLASPDLTGDPHRLKTSKSRPNSQENP